MATKFIILGIFFLLGFRLAHYLLRFFHHSRKLNQQIGYYFVILEILTWLTLVIWTLADVYRTMDSKLILVFGAVALVFSVPVYYLARDFIMGIYLKIQHKVEKGEHISIEALSGEIIKSGNLNLYIKNSQGLIHTIPYSKIATQTIVKLSLNPNLKKQNLTFSIPQG
ncbi:MAG: Mechanosensitive ion channel, partial [Bacteroidota bacterium]